MKKIKGAVGTIPIQLIIITSLLAILISIVFLFKGFTIVYPHLYYIPIIITAYFYPRKGIQFSLCLSAIYLLLIALFGTPDYLDWASAISRVFLFIIIAVIISYLVIRQQSLEAEKIEHQKRYEELFRHMKSGAAVYRPVENGEDFEFVDINPGAEKIDRIKKEDVIGKKVTDVFPGIVDYGLHKVFREVFETGKTRSHPISKYTDSRISGWRENSVFKLPSGEIVAIYDDVTEKIKSEEEIRNLSSFREKVIDDSNVWVVVSNIQGQVIIWNKAAEKITGYAREEVAESNAIWKKITPELDDRKTIAKKINDIIRKGGDIDELPFPIVNKSGEKRYLKISLRTLQDENNLPYAIVGMALDITNEKIAREELILEHSRLNNIIEFLPDATFVINREGKVISWNRAIEKMTGMQKNEIIGKGDYAYSLAFYKEKGPILIDYIQSPISELNERYNNVQKVEKTLSAEVFIPDIFDGRGGHTLVMASPLYDNEGAIIGAIESIRDISEIKKKEMELIKSLEEKNLIINEIHHRVKNNLQIISALIQLEISYMKSEDDREMCDNLNKRVVAIANVYENLIDTKDFLEIDMKKLVDVFILNTQFSRLHDVEISYNVNIIDIKFDLDTAVTLSLIITELLNNAVKHAFVGKEKGNIILSLDKDSLDQYILEVSDNGIGYKGEKDLLKSKTLGMRLVGILVERNLHGNIEISVNGGTRFIISFRKPKRHYSDLIEY